MVTTSVTGTSWHESCYYIGMNKDSIKFPLQLQPISEISEEEKKRLKELEKLFGHKLWVK